MTNGRSRRWMWADALDLLDRVDRLHRQSFAPVRPFEGVPGWEPPVDMLETEHEVLVFVALPGVDIGQVDVTIDEATGTLLVRGQRILPPELRTAVIHRMELPQGRFERRLALPAGHYDAIARSSVNGCLLLSLRKAHAGGLR